MVGYEQDSWYFKTISCHTDLQKKLLTSVTPPKVLFAKSIIYFWRKMLWSWAPMKDFSGIIGYVTSSQISVLLLPPPRVFLGTVINLCKFLLHRSQKMQEFASCSDLGPAMPLPHSCLQHLRVLPLSLQPLPSDLCFQIHGWSSPLEIGRTMQPQQLQ